MTTKACAIVALAKLRNRPTSRYSPAALDEELVDAVLDAIRTPSEAMLVSGLVALVKEIEKLGMPDADKQRLMQIGAQMRTSTEVEKCWRAIIDTIKDNK